jgi:hypothetical protein
VLQIFPFLAWLAAITSAALLAGLAALGELQGARLGVLAGWFLIAGFLQFFGMSAIETLGGLLLQTILAVYLLLRWKMSG